MNNIKNIDTTFELTPGLKKLQGATTYFEKLKEMTLLGVTSGMKSSGSIIALFLLNFLFLIIAGCIIGFSSKFEYKQLVYLAVVVLLGGLFVFLAVKRMLSLLQLDYTLYVFNQFEPFIRKICAAIVDKAEKSTEKMATCVVVLDKEKTPFYSFGKDPYPNSNFITQKFKLKYNERSGWKIIKK